MAKSGGASLAATLASVIGPVSNLDIGQHDGRKQLEYYDIDQIDVDPKNFYSVDGLEELASNILFAGLQQPLLVRQSSDDPQRFQLISGHRRRAAIRLLVDEGHTQMRRVACIVEGTGGSSTMQELLLIFGNKDTRVPSPAELSRQAERIERLLYDLKKEGYEFPGKMRDYVAEACKVSASKLARLKVIRENLVPELKNAFDAEKLNESVAYTLAKQSPELQRLILQYRGKKEMKYWSESSISQDMEKAAKITSRKGKKCGEICINQKAMLDKVFADGYGYRPCDRHCCEKCDLLTNCKAACPFFSEKIKKLKTDAREQSRQNKLAREAKEAPVIESLQVFWLRFGYAREHARKSVKQVMEAMDRYCGESQEKEWLERENATAKFTTETSLPYGYNFSFGDAKHLCAAADLFGCTTDFLLCRTDEPTPSPAAPVWQEHAEYPSGKHLIALFYLPGAPRLLRKPVYSFNGKLYFDESFIAPVTMDPVAWCVQPELPDSLKPHQDMDEDCEEDFDDADI